ncbi:MAG: hypothetical protein QNJ22_00300 [Desulfosarcinaceae bacterium]|nr:hypothetical protein [Desulfosarcinaceae bacterium]
MDLTEATDIRVETDRRTAPERSVASRYAKKDRSGNEISASDLPENDLAANDLIALWERGNGRSPTEKALLALTYGRKRELCDAVARWPIGVRDQALIRRAAAIFGPITAAVTTCSACERPVAFDIDLQGMGAGRAAGRRPLRFRYAGEAYDFRLPNSTDFQALMTVADGGLAQHRLARRCIRSTATRTDGATADASKLPKGLLKAFAEAIEACDPLADIRLTLTCPDCRHRWQEPFDIVDYFWQALTREAHALLVQVDLLARTYGWSEDAILSLGAARRALYTEMILS